MKKIINIIKKDILDISTNEIMISTKNTNILRMILIQYSYNKGKYYKYKYWVKKYSKKRIIIAILIIIFCFFKFILWYKKIKND